MTPRDRYGGSDVIRADPKPKRGAHWKQSLRAARLYADQWAREYVKGKWNRCVTCGSAINLQWAHVLSGRAQSIRWEEKNMTIQCEPCNNLAEYEPQHIVGWFVATYGQLSLAQLVIQGNTLVKWTYSQIMKIGDGYRELVRALG